jgi:hypothetical protein
LASGQTDAAKFAEGRIALDQHKDRHGQRLGASRVKRAPFELDRSEHVEGFRIDRGGSVGTDPPTADGVLEVDHLDATVGAMEEQALLAKRAFELVTKLRVTHDLASCEIGYGTMSSMTRGES